MGGRVGEHSHRGREEGKGGRGLVERNLKSGIAFEMEISKTTHKNEKMTKNKYLLNDGNIKDTYKDPNINLPYTKPVYNTFNSNQKMLFQSFLGAHKNQNVQGQASLNKNA